MTVTLADDLFDRPPTDPPQPPDLFRRWTMAELAAEPDHFQWLISGMFANPTYGMVAGEMKTLKTYFNGFVMIGLATGTPIFDRFKPPGACPIVAYVGEGGRLPWTRRMRRIAPPWESGSKTCPSNRPSTSPRSPPASSGVPGPRPQRSQPGARQSRPVLLVPRGRRESLRPAPGSNRAQRALRALR